VLHFTLLYCPVLHCIALHCPVLHCIALHCPLPHCIALHCPVLQCIALHCPLPHCTALYCTVLYCTEIFVQIKSLSKICEFCIILFQSKIIKVSFYQKIYNEVKYFAIDWVCIMCVYKERLYDTCYPLSVGQKSKSLTTELPGMGVA
jgi:hypothetical protein